MDYRTAFVIDMDDNSSNVSSTAVLCIRRADITLVWMNLLFLLFIALVGYFTGLLTTYDTHRIVVISFSGIMAATGFVLCLIWGYATHNRRLVDEDIPDHLIRYFLNRTFVTPLIFLTSIGI